MFQIAGGAIGLGLTTAIFTTRSEDKLAAGLRKQAPTSAHQTAVLHGDLAGTDAAAAALSQLPASAADTIRSIVAESFVLGVQTSFRVIAAIALAGLVVRRLLRPPRRPGHVAQHGAFPPSAGFVIPEMTNRGIDGEIARLAARQHGW